VSVLSPSSIFSSILPPGGDNQNNRYILPYWQNSRVKKFVYRLKGSTLHAKIPSFFNSFVHNTIPHPQCQEKCALVNGLFTVLKQKLLQYRFFAQRLSDFLCKIHPDIFVFYIKIS
jgi:hypothetical protein